MMLLAARNHHFIAFQQIIHLFLFANTCSYAIYGYPISRIIKSTLWHSQSRFSKWNESLNPMDCITASVSHPGSNVAVRPTNTVHSGNRALMVASIAYNGRNSGPHSYTKWISLTT